MMPYMKGAQNGTDFSVNRGSEKSMPSYLQAVLTVNYIIGVIGNSAALCILWARHHRKRPRGNSKHALMLCCLACNDLVALLGMLVQMYVALYVPKEMLDKHWKCIARVVWRLFGLGSGCVAAVMALERWLALTQPFLYQKHVTFHLILLAIILLWSHVLILVLLPFAGFGLYMKENECLRYRFAEKPEDIAYAYLYFTFGALLCFCIVWCNLAVVRALCHMDCRGLRGNSSPLLGRRISRHSSRQLAFHGVRPVALPGVATGCADVKETHQQCTTKHIIHKLSPQTRRKLFISGRAKPAHASTDGSDLVTAGDVPSSLSVSYNACTSEEVAFARLMTVLSISFVVCWAPQLISILLAQFAPQPKAKHLRPFFNMADMLMALHFTLDPYVYVLLRHRDSKSRPCMPDIFKFFCRRCSYNSSTQVTTIELTEHQASCEVSVAKEGSVGGGGSSSGGFHRGVGEAENESSTSGEKHSPHN